MKDRAHKAGTLALTSGPPLQTSFNLCEADRFLPVSSLKPPQTHPGVARMLAPIPLSTSNLDGARVAPNRGSPSRTRPCTSSYLERFPLRGRPPDPSPPRAGAAYRREVALLFPPQEPRAVVPARMA